MEVHFSAPPLGNPINCRAFIPSFYGKFDYSDLNRFATNRIVMSGYTAVYPDQADEVSRTVAWDMLNIIKQRKFNNKFDYLVLAGDPVLIAAAVAAISKHVDSFVALRYDKQSQSYWAIKI